MKKLSSWIYLLLTALAIAGAFWVMFVTMNSPTLIASPYVGLGIMIPLILLAFLGFIHSVMQKPDAEEEAKEKIIEAIIVYSKIFYANHRYSIDATILHDIIEYSMKFKHDPRPKAKPCPPIQTKKKDDVPYNESL